MRFYLLAAFLLLLSRVAFPQTSFVATQSGLWNDPITWGLPACPGTCVAGTDFPGAMDDVFTNGFQINVTSGATCKNLLVSASTVNGLLGPANLTVTGTLAGWNDGISFPEAPTVAVIPSNVALTFTGANVDGAIPFVDPSSIIAAWGSVAPLNAVVINFSSGAQWAIDAGDPFFGVGDSELRFGSISFSTGTGSAQLSSGPNLTAIRLSTLAIGANRILDVSVPISGPTGTLTSNRGGTITVNGTLTTSTYVNCTNLTLGSTGVFETSFSGPDQIDGGWWHVSSTDPTNAATAFNVTSTFNFAGSSQNVLFKQYGNIILSGTGTKTLLGSGTLTISRNLTLESGVTFSSATASQVNIGGNLTVDGTWTPTGTLNFNGASPVTSQTISGTGTHSIQTLRVATGTGNSLTIGKAITVSNGINVITGAALVLGANIALTSGNISNLGAITATAGTLTFSALTDLTGAGTATLNNVTVTGTGIVTFENAVSINTLTVNASGSASFEMGSTFRGNIVNNGTITFPTAFSVTFTGGTAQAISGSPLTIYDMVMNKSTNTLTNNATVTLLGNLTMTSGTLNASGSGGAFILNSDTDRDATIGVMTAGQITGNVTFRRYFNNTENRWRNFGFPVTGVTVANLNASSFPIQTNSFSWYNETTLGNVDQGFTSLNSGTLVNKRGYSAYMYNTTPITVSVVGPLLQNQPALAGSPYAFAVTYTNDPAQPASEDGWNLVANPFACPMNWNSASGWTKTRVNAAAAVWDATNFVYRYSNVDWDGIVAQGQAFWIQSNAAAPIVNCTEAVKSASTFDPSFFRMKENAATEEKLIIKLDDGKYSDKAALQFVNSATDEFDPSVDAYKLKNSIFNLSTLTKANVSLAANTLPISFCATKVHLRIADIVPGSYGLTLSGIHSLEAITEVRLVDNFTGEEISVSEGERYSFQVTEDAKSFGDGRFELKISFSGSEFNFPTVTQATSTLLVSNYTAGNEWFFNGLPIQGATADRLTATKAGEYQVKVTNGDCSYLSESLTVAETNSIAYPNPAQEYINVNVLGYLANQAEAYGLIKIYSTSGSLVEKIPFVKTDFIKTIDTKNFRTGEYVLFLTAGENNIVGQEKILIKK